MIRSKQLSFCPKKCSVDGDNSGKDNLVPIAYSLEDCRKVFARYLVIEEQPFRKVESYRLQYLLSMFRLDFHSPSGITATKDVYELILEEKQKLKLSLDKLRQRVSFTTDTWTSS